MTDGVQRRRDFWDILDILARVTTGVFLGALAFLIPNASQRIAASIDSGKLVQAMMSDLTTADERTRQDLALIALNRSVSKKNGVLVSEIAERIYFDLSARDTLGQGLGRVAYAVLKSRDPARAKVVKDSMEAAAGPARPEMVSPADTAQLRTVTEAPQAQLISRIHPLVAYIQYHDDTDRLLAETLRVEISAAGFWAPGVDQVDGEYRNWVRYFHGSDAAAARRAQEVTERFLRARGRPVQVKTQDLSNRGFKAPEGQIEVWLRLAPQ